MLIGLTGTSTVHAASQMFHNPTTPRTANTATVSPFGFEVTKQTRLVSSDGEWPSGAMPVSQLYRTHLSV